jgi:sterol desaturase/sphingolipid hydroxylase (fatty acid hydroxylase superfamily)
MWHIVLSILSYDIWFYLSHIFLHRVLFDLHRIHHAANAEELRWTDTYRSHPVEDMIQGVGAFFPFFFYTYTVVDAGIIVLFLNVRGMIRHDARLGGHHVLHHQHPSYNYGEYWIDWLCGTVYDNHAVPSTRAELDG